MLQLARLETSLFILALSIFSIFSSASEGAESASYLIAKESGTPPTNVPSIRENDGNSFMDTFRAFIDIDRDGKVELFAFTTRYNLKHSRQTAPLAVFRFYSRKGSGWRELSGIIENPQDTCLHPREAAVADFNSDGRPDLFVACHGWDANPWPGERNKVVLSQPSGTYRIADAGKDVGFFHSVAAADFNSDGKMDVVLTNNFAKQQVQVFLGNGKGTFRSTSRYMPSSVRKTGPFFTVELPDIDGDGDFDLFVAGHDWDGAETAVHINPGNMRFSDRSKIRIPAIKGYGVVLDAVATEKDGDHFLWILRTTGGDGKYYNGNLVQRLNLQTGESKIVANNTRGHWSPSLIVWTQGGQTYVGSDDKRSVISPLRH